MRILFHVLAELIMRTTLVAVALLTVASACGQQQAAVVDVSPLQVIGALGDPDPVGSPCIVIKVRIKNDFDALKKTPAFAELAKTPEYAAVSATVKTFVDQHCP